MLCPRRGGSGLAVGLGGGYPAVPLFHPLSALLFSDRPFPAPNRARLFALLGAIRSPAACDCSVQHRVLRRVNTLLSSRVRSRRLLVNVEPAVSCLPASMDIVFGSVNPAPGVLAT